MSSTLGRIGRRLVSSLNVDGGRGAAAASFLGGGGRFFAKCRQPTTSILQLPSSSSSPPLAAATSTARYRYFSSASANASHHHPSSSRSLPAAVSKGALGLLSPCFGFSCFHPQHQQLRLGGAGTLLLRQKHTLKTNRSVAKRIRVRGNGSLKRCVPIH